MGASGQREGTSAGSPLVLVAAMLAIAILLEWAIFGRWLWQPKLPLAVLLAVAFLRLRRRERRA
jgi:hypothetical protein